MLKLLILLSIIFTPPLLPTQDIQVQPNVCYPIDDLKEKSASIGLGDIDNDGVLDAVIANGRHWPGQNRISINNEHGRFTVSRPLGVISATSYATEVKTANASPEYVILDEMMGHGMKKPD